MWSKLITEQAYNRDAWFYDVYKIQHFEEYNGILQYKRPLVLKTRNE